ncbi:hypothetical protein U9M48_008751 [Paspalum notatum var. saurae]|uniref:Cytochrome P450 n=1 Tax=Paspalum notatum var. saurae TaxID=547442 RepID=A0AAQ3SQS4_PASNO
MALPPHMRAIDMSKLQSSFTNDILCHPVARRPFRVEGRNKMFQELIDAGMVFVGGFNLENFYLGLAKVAGGVLTWPAHRRTEMLRSRWDNIFDALIDEHEREMARGDLQDMFTTGTDTTYLVLEFSMAELMLHQHALAKLQAEKCSANVDSYIVPAGTMVFNAWAIGRDPRMWAASHEFMSERFIDNMGDITGADFGGNDFQFLPFGSGRTICPGVNFALASIEIMLANLAYHFDWELPQGVHHIDMTEVFALTVRQKEMKLLLIPRPIGFILPNVE